MIALYEIVDFLVQHKCQLTRKRFNDYKLFRPSDEEILDLQNYVSNIMDAFAEKISSVNAYITCENDNPANCESEGMINERHIKSLRI